jgi:hypothetical protein
LAFSSGAVYPRALNGNAVIQALFEKSDIAISMRCKRQIMQPRKRRL